MEYVVLGLGSNRAYKDYSCVELLIKACTSIHKILTDVRVSSVYRTQAMYVEDQEDFYNMVVGGFYNGSPLELLQDIHKIEQSLGRNRQSEIRFGSRSMDIDIEIFGNLRIREDDLIIPHERLTERAFVLAPLLDLFDDCSGERREYFPCIEGDEVIKYSFFSSKLKELHSQRIEKIIDKEKFLTCVSFG